MKILFLAEYATPLKYGFGTAHHYLAKTLIKNHKKKVTIFSSAFNHYMKKTPKKSVEEIDNVVYRWIPCFKYNTTKSKLRVLNWLIFPLISIIYSLFNKFDIIVVSSHSMFPTFTAYFHKLIYGTKVITDVRDVWPMTFIEVGKISKNNPLIQLMSFAERFAVKNSDGIISTLPNYKLRISELLANSEKPFVNIPQGYDFELVNKDYKQVLNFNFDKKKLNIIYAGAIGITNALHTILETALMMDENRFHFYFLGDGDLKNDFVNKYGKNSHITFLPKIEKQYVNSILKKMDLGYDSVVNSKLYDYGLSRQKWMDYMNASIPIIASFSGYKSILNKYNCGFYAKAESIQNLKDIFLECAILKKKKILNSMGKNGFLAVKKYRNFDTLSLKLNTFIMNIFNNYGL